MSIVSLIINAVHANLLYMARRYDEAIEVCRRTIELDLYFPEVDQYLSGRMMPKVSTRTASPRGRRGAAFSG